MQPVPNHPYALWQSQWDPRRQQLIMHFACSLCGDQTEWHCSRPQLQGYRIMQYAGLHAHGLRPVVHQSQPSPNMMVAYGPPPPPGGWRNRGGWEPT